MSPLSAIPNYRYRGARAMILMHEQHLREFLDVWRQARAAGVVLPVTDDPDYQSLEHLLHHVLRAARGYMTWICEQLDLPDPGIEPAPPPERVNMEAGSYLEQLCARWRLPLVDQDEARLSYPTYKARWGMEYSIDSMLEHALVHPQRHLFQLRELLEATP